MLSGEHFVEEGDKSQSADVAEPVDNGACEDAVGNAAGWHGSSQFQPHPKKRSREDGADGVVAPLKSQRQDQDRSRVVARGVRPDRVDHAVRDAFSAWTFGFTGMQRQIARRTVEKMMANDSLCSHLPQDR